MEFVQNLDPMSWMILVASALIILFVLFAKFITLAVKLVVVAVMMIWILYFLRQAGAF